MYTLTLVQKHGIVKLRPIGLDHAGSYFICDEEGTNVAVFKPEDEEPLAINNPRGVGSSADHNGSGLRRGIKPGEGAVREVAAFLLDHQHFSGVPPTAMVTCLQRRPSADIMGAVSLEEAKLGSLQQFVQSDGDCEERGSSVFAVKQVSANTVLTLTMSKSFLERVTACCNVALIQQGHDRLFFGMSVIE